MHDDIKFAFIYGHTPVDGANFEGITEAVYIDDEATHIEYLRNFFKTHFKEDEYLQKNISDWTANQVGLYMRELGHIVYFNETSYNKENPKKRGIFMMPDETSEKQLEGLENFKHYIKNYYAISIWKDFYKDEYGSLTCTNMTNENYDLSVEELLDIYISKNQKTK